MTMTIRIGCKLIFLVYAGKLTRVMNGVRCLMKTVASCSSISGEQIGTAWIGLGCWLITGRSWSGCTLAMISSICSGKSLRN